MKFRDKLLKLILVVFFVYIFNVIQFSKDNAQQSKIKIKDFTLSINNQSRGLLLRNRHTHFNRIAHKTNQQPRKALRNRTLLDMKCDTEWEHLNREIYFKRTNQFYFVDESLFHTFYVTHSAKILFPLKLELWMLVYFRDAYLTDYTSNVIVIKRPWAAHEYGLGSIDLRLDLKQLLEQKYQIDFKIHLDSINVEFFYHDLTTKQNTTKPLKLILKYLRTPKENKEKTSLICVKCLFMGATEYKHFSWWLELNKRSGYDKIVMCNNSIPDTDEFRAIFKKHSGFVQVNQLQCLPNFLPSIPGEYYVDGYSDLALALRQDIFSGLILNEVSKDFHFD